MKKIINLLSILSVFLLISFIKDNVQASLTTNELIAIKDADNQNYIVVTKNTTINDIMAKYGNARVITDSAFGGKAYTFYTDDNYSNFLYVETAKNGKIISYGSVGTKFETQKYVGGTTRPTSGLTMNLSGYVYDYDELVYGVILYNKEAIAGKTATAICNEYVNTYRANPTKYLRGISEQGVTFYNAVSHFLGNDVNLVFDERIFYINEQFKEFGSSIRLYMQEMDKSSEVMRGLTATNGIPIVHRNSAYVLNPLRFGALASSNIYTNFRDKNIAVFDYCEEQDELFSAVTVSPDCFERVNTVNLTAEEVKKLNSGRSEYENAIKNLYADSEIYEINPVEKPENISELVAGKLKASKKQGITDYVNAIRVAAGLPKLNLNEDCFNTAQHISTLLSYRWQVLGQDIAHQPAKETLPGITDEYYNTAVGWGKGYYENLGRSATQTSVKAMINHIALFLDDTAEQGLFFSHRQKILHADHTEFGYGISTQTFANEFTGYNRNDVYLEAWPANGITFLETVKNLDKIYWTAQFTDKYKFLDTTDAKITCLNTGYIWEFTEEMITSSKRYSIQIDNISSLNNRVIMYDSGIRPHEGYVYEVKFTGIQETSTGKIVDYSYRTVFEYADLNNYPSQTSEINIDKSKINLNKVDGTDIYYLPIGEDIKLFALLDNDVTDKKITWTSSDPSVTVTQNGIVHASDSNIDNPVTISVVYDATSISSSVTFMPYKKTSQITLEANKQTLNKGQNTDLIIKDLPDDIVEQASFRWYVVSDNESIRQYVEIQPYEDDKLKAKVIAHDAEMSNNNYTIKVEVESANGNIYIGECEVTVLVPLESLRISIKTNGIEMLQSSKTITVDLDKTNIEYLELKTKPTPTNITNAKNAKWTSSNTDVLEFIDTYLDSRESIGRFQVKNEGVTNVTAEIDGKNDTVKVIVKIALKSLTINDNNKEKTVAINDTYKLPYSRSPLKDTDKLYFGSTNENVAKIDANGLITFVGSGKTTITVSNIQIDPNTKTAKSGSIYSTIEYDIKIKGGELVRLKGDMNKDGKVNATDAAMVLDRYKYKNATYEDMQIGDMNNDGKLNATDAALILDVYKNNK